MSTVSQTWQALSDDSSMARAQSTPAIKGTALQMKRSAICSSLRNSE